MGKKNRDRERAREAETFDTLINRVEFLGRSEELARKLVTYGVDVGSELRGLLEAKPSTGSSPLFEFVEDYRRLSQIHEALNTFWRPYEEPSGLNPYTWSREAQAAGELERFQLWGKIGDHLGFDDSE